MIRIYLWLLHRLTGFLLVFFLIFHILYFHWFNNSYDYIDIVLRIEKLPWKLFYLIFLISSIYHGVYGINTIIKEYTKNTTLLKALQWALLLLSFVIAFTGVSLLFS